MEEGERKGEVDGLDLVVSLEAALRAALDRRKERAAADAVATTMLNPMGSASVW